MTINQQVGSVAGVDRRPACYLSMPPAGGGLMARDALEIPPAGLLDQTTEEMGQMTHYLGGDDADVERQLKGRRTPHGTPNDNKESSEQIDVEKRGRGNSAENNDIYISNNVLNRILDSGDMRKSKPSKNSIADNLVFNQSASTNARRKDVNAVSPAQERKKQDSGSLREREESFIGENIAGNNAGHYYSEELLPIQYASKPDGLRGSSTDAPLICARCGEAVPNLPNGVCKHCMHRGKHADLKGGTLDEIIAYAQSLAMSVKKMLTTKEGAHLEANNVRKADFSKAPQLAEPSQKLQRYQSEIPRQKMATSYTMSADDKQPRKSLETSTPAPSVCGDDMDTMSLVDGDHSKDPRGKLQRQASSVASTESRPPFSRAKTKVKALFSTSRTKTFRSRTGRARTDHELKNDSVTSTVSAKIDSRRSGIPESTRKSGRTQTFDSSNLYGRKDVTCRSKLEVMQEGSPVDPPIHDDKMTDKAHKYAISRSATSPGTPGIKLQREKSNFGTCGPLMRTNTKLTLRANKAAVLRKENIYKAATLFHQQPAAEAGDGSPVFERKRGHVRLKGENKTKIRPLSPINEKHVSDNIMVREISDAFSTSANSSSKQETKVLSEPVPQQLAEDTSSELYCGNKSYSSGSKVGHDSQAEMSSEMAELRAYESEVIEKNPYCDDLHHYGRGLADQLLKPVVVENQSALAITPYFDKSIDKPVNETEITLESNGKEISLYTDAAVVKETSQNKPGKRSSVQWYSLQGVWSKSSTQLREATRVKSSLSDIVASRSSMIGLGSPHTRKHIKYTETDVDSGTIYHMAKRIASDQKLTSHNDFAASSNFFEIGGDVSKSSSSTSGHSSSALETEYTGGFFRDAFEDSEKKDVSESLSNISESTYFDYEGESKSEHLECDVYTGSVFSPSANNLALASLNDNWKNKSTNNSNRLPSYRCRSKTTMAHINNRRILNCSNNSSSFVERSRSPSPESFDQGVVRTHSFSYYSRYHEPLKQPIRISFPNTIEFAKYENFGMDEIGIFFSSPSKYQNSKDVIHEMEDMEMEKLGKQYCRSARPHIEIAIQHLHTLKDKNTNMNNGNGAERYLNANNNYFGDFYTGEASGQWATSHDRRSNQASTSSGDFVSSPSPKYAPGSFYENAYPEPQQSPPPPTQTQNSFLSIFTGYGEPPAAQVQYSPEYAGSFPQSVTTEGLSHSPGANLYESYGRTSSASPKRHTYDQDGYFDYHSPRSVDERQDNLESGRSPVPPVPKIKRVGAIICRENVANKDDYAEDVNRDLMEDPWIPISYRLAAEQVKEMGGGRCSSKELFKTTEAKCDPSLLDASPFAQGHMLETLGRKSAGWNLKQNTDSLKEDISMKWRDAREKSSRMQQHQQQQQQHHSQKTRRGNPDTVSTKTSISSVWRPTDHIPAKARGNRTVVKSEAKGSTQLDKDGANTNNSRVWSAVMWVPSTVGSYVKRLW